MERRFDGLQMEHVHRSKNFAADALSQMAARWVPVPPGIFVERLTKPSITPPKIKTPVAPGPDPGTAESPGKNRATPALEDEEPIQDSSPSEAIILALER